MFPHHAMKLLIESFLGKGGECPLSHSHNDFPQQLCLVKARQSRLVPHLRHFWGEMTEKNTTNGCLSPTSLMSYYDQVLCLTNGLLVPSPPSLDLDWLQIVQWGGVRTFSMPHYILIIKNKVDLYSFLPHHQRQAGLKCCTKKTQLVSAKSWLWTLFM